MKKILVVAAVVAIVIVGIAVATAGNQGQCKPQGPAPNSHDGISDGSGFDSSYGIGPAYGPGPAPNSHDGNPDGPGW